MKEWAVLSIQQTLSVQADSAVQRVAGLRAPGRFLLSGMLAGVYIGIGVVLMLSVAGPLVSAGDGMAKLVAGLVFGVALTLVVFAGADLVTSAMMIFPQGVLMGGVGAGRALVALVAMFLANLLGSFVFAALIVASGVLRSNEAAGRMLAELLEAKAHESPIELLTRGILCNLLVCLAVWMGARVASEVAKILLIFAAITAFISSGFEHVVANMTSYSLGILIADPHATWALFGGNLLWVGLGNLLGGGAVVGAGYWLIGGRPVLRNTGELQGATVQGHSASSSQ